MSCCPSVKCRNTGSGYVKPTGESKECNKKLDELLAARAQQDTTYFPPIVTTPQVQLYPTSTPSNLPTIPSGRR